MKRKFTSIMLAMFGFAAQAQLLPNEDSPVGFLYDFNKDNYTYYTSEYVPSGVAAGSITTEDNNLKYTGTSNSSTFQLQLYKTVAGGVPVQVLIFQQTQLFT